MILKENEYVEGVTMAHWCVYYRTRSGRIANMIVDAVTPEEAMDVCQKSRRGFKRFELGHDGKPIVSRMIYANEVCS